MTKLLLTGMIGLCLSAVQVGFAAAQPRKELPAYALRPGQMIDVGGYRLNLYCFGSGRPTVVFLSGGAWGAVAWAGVQPGISQHTRTCSYDRAAMNFSDVGPVRPTPDQDFRDLAALLERASVSPPYVLVGWSAGGMLARWYADRHPDEVVGLVTVDGSDFDFWESPEETTWLAPALEAFRRCADAARKGLLDSDRALFDKCSGYGNPLPHMPELRRALEPSLHNPDLYARWLHELENVSEGAATLRGLRRSFGALPMRVIVAGSHMGNAAADAAFVQHSFQIASLSTGSRMIVLPGTTHAIHLDRPDDVNDIIEEVVTLVRRQPPVRAN
ncbi:MAG TPA: alpha/beta hydrolase [Steroidobacteraceae bacterium]|jgi:pimeloyl-ACP methyl ester carboxylesterase|nr:alpha/beta hydrolase [Steroidobacteraceae bacterium]